MTIRDSFLQPITIRYHLLPFVIFLSLFFFFLRPPTDPDLGWHLRYGQMMWQTQNVPRVDNFSSTMTGYRWADSYWLSEVFIYGLYRLGGYYLLTVVFSLIASFSLFISFEGLSFPKEGKSFWGEVTKLILSLFFGVLLIISFVGTRPQTISLLFFSTTLLLLRHRRYYFLPPLFLFWANFHAGFVLGLALVWLWSIGEWLDEILENRVRRNGGTESIYLFIRHLSFPVYPFLSTLVTFVNPYGPFLWHSILQDVGSFEIKQHIAEWTPPVLRSDFGFFYFVYLVLLLVLAGLNLKKERFSYLLPALFFVFLSLSALRHIPLLVLLTLPFVYRSLPRLSFSAVKYLFLWGFLVFFGVSVFSFLGFLAPIIDRQWTATELRSIGNYPSGAAAYLQKHPRPPGRLFNTYGWGGYFLWNVPGLKTFIDGRMPGWRIEGQPTLFSEYLKVVNLQSGWLEVLNKYDVSSFVLDKTTPLSQALLISRQWQKTYEDSGAVVFERHDSP